MRIISGEFKNRIIPIKSKFIALHNVRPTTNYTRTLLFNLLRHNPLIKNNILKDAVVADICCGSGLIGMEMISNGAAKCYFIENNLELCTQITQNLSHLSCAHKSSILNSITSIKNIKDTLDIIYIDPPYDAQEQIIHNFIDIAHKSHGITKETLVIAEVNKNISEYILEQNCTILFARKSLSDTYLIFFNLNKGD